MNQNHAPHTQELLEQYRKLLPVYEKMADVIPEKLKDSFDEATNLILPYAGLKTLIIESDTKRPMPEFRAALSGIGINLG